MACLPAKRSATETKGVANVRKLSTKELEFLREIFQDLLHSIATELKTPDQEMLEQFDCYWRAHLQLVRAEDLEFAHHRTTQLPDLLHWCKMEAVRRYSPETLRGAIWHVAETRGEAVSTPAHIAQLSAEIVGGRAAEMAHPIVAIREQALAVCD